MATHFKRVKVWAKKSDNVWCFRKQIREHMGTWGNMLEASFGTIGNLVGTKYWENQILEKIQTLPHTLDLIQFPQKKKLEPS